MPARLCGSLVFTVQVFFFFNKFNNVLIDNILLKVNEP